MNATDDLRNLTVKETAKRLNISEQGVRFGLQQKVFPFGVAVKFDKNYEYYIFEKRLDKYLKGEM